MIVVDSSALVAVFTGESDADALLAAIAEARAIRISAVSLVELLMVLDARTGRDNEPPIRAFVAEAGILVVPVDEELAWQAVAAWWRFGKGNHPARLNHGDCFAYALARRLGAPLLYKGGDFAQTDVTAAR